MNRNRYLRQLQLPGFGEAGQQKLAEAKVLVVGAGPAGLEAARGGLADLADQVEIRQAMSALSSLADASLETATRRALGTPARTSPRGLCVIAMGKLGGREIGYGSDLDVIFVFEPSAAPPDQDPTAFFTRAARRVISYVSMSHSAGPGYELDTRLRQELLDLAIAGDNAELRLAFPAPAAAVLQ